MTRLLLLLISSTLLLHAEQKILPKNQQLTFTGAFYSSIENGLLVLQRHSSEILAMDKTLLNFSLKKAQTTSGVVLKFKTNSQSLTFKFIALEGENRGSEFAIYENKKLKLEKKFSKKQTEMIFDYKKQDKGWSEIEVILPSWSKVAFKEMLIDDSASIKKSTPQKMYVAFGDSISHGTGQGSASYKTWPFILSKNLGYDLYNLAVGGGKVSIPAAKLLKDFPKVEIITLLIGYNDMNTGISPQQFAEKYKEFLSIATQAQPQAQIYCISPLYTKTLKSRKSEHTIDEFRMAVTTAVNYMQKSNPNIKLVVGHEISSEKNLRIGSKDPVHLSVVGAQMFADELTLSIKK
ncbi:MAG: SGNH/GDSL hydrolase family protein [Lentisphaeraceae bacterium]|nr:SGNH/GDSL hydrolase family protein [Lentisphaeraceae bacterium]